MKCFASAPLEHLGVAQGSAGTGEGEVDFRQIVTGGDLGAGVGQVGEGAPDPES